MFKINSISRKITSSPHYPLEFGSNDNIREDILNLIALNATFLIRQIWEKLCK